MRLLLCAVLFVGTIYALAKKHVEASDEILAGICGIDNAVNVATTSSIDDAAVGLGEGACGLSYG